ncbi:bifunctional riboflavin kinase/FAD synthetase [Pseudohoeflea suaedae]|uniref:Riboflavin biosynthesis protein n=1 Tax=Pseudohoeflea suaedae TaxID=877384 RepID=A0A4R5PN53_9HYPH|nr:bifunctional riboflavin kinase/FAD synthetase [Pseudohoeflea suaedae]TDH38480.1 bifunctional riboflavin kinase/FAD synthetase [Pseudohoeflea suaedae]
MAERIQELSGLAETYRGGVVAIGNFDGVHRGHQAVLAEALEIARARGTSLHLLTFEPHPRTTFRPDEPVYRITPAELKARLLGLCGVTAIFEQEFTRDYAAMSAGDFINDVLVRDLGAIHVVTGGDFRFGKGRAGDAAMLAAAGAKLGFDTSLAADFEDEGGAIISSSRIRSLLVKGDVSQAAGLLGYRYTISGEVVHGKKLGRTLGYPTANMPVPEETGLAPGIYAVRLRRADGSLHDGVASFGRRPTVEEPDAPLLLETYVFDAAPDLYGEICDVSLFGFLRSEEKFDGLDELVVQMKADDAEARAVLAGVRPLGQLDETISF